jgi:excisionase family DNA binding protein
MTVERKQAHMTTTQPLTVRQFAGDLNLSEPTVRSWLAQRRISCIRLGRAVRIPSSERDRLLSDDRSPFPVTLSWRVSDVL